MALSQRESLSVELVTETCAWPVDNTNNFPALYGGIFNFEFPYSDAHFYILYMLNCRRCGTNSSTKPPENPLSIGILQYNLVL